MDGVFRLGCEPVGHRRGRLAGPGSGDPVRVGWPLRAAVRSDLSLWGAKETTSAKKNAIKAKGHQASNALQQRALRLAELVKLNLYRFVIEQGMKALDQLPDEDRERLFSPVSHAKYCASGRRLFWPVGTRWLEGTDDRSLLRVRVATSSSRTPTGNGSRSA
jgi:hypothetical protein